LGIVIKVSHELELKLELQPKGMRRLIRAAELKDAAGHKRVENLVSTYFDTDNEKLRDRGISLRVRRNGKRYLQTIKWLSGSAWFDRGESESEIKGDKPDWKAARGTPLEALLSARARRSLKPRFQTRVRRTTYPIARAGAEIQLAVDDGAIRAGRRSAPIRELELELKRGDPSELFRFARDLARSVPVRLALKSKAERGYVLLNGGVPVAVKAREIELHAGTGVAEAFRIIARACLAQIVGNEAGVQSRDSEALHQIRVGLRRLRAAISFYSEIVAGAQTELVKSELRWITRELSPARDLDVYISEVLGPLYEQHKDEADFRSLYRDFERRRAEAFDRAVDAVRSDRYRNLLIDVAAWIEAGGWSRPEDEAVRVRHERPMELHAAEQLARRRKKIVKKGKKFRRLDGAQRHRLRIAVKKFRYAAEFVANVFPGKKSGKRRRALLDTLKRLQDSLGTLNDMVVHVDLNRSMVDSDGKESAKLARGRAFIAGLVSGQEEAKADRLTEAAVAAFAGLGSIKPFWK
jgi:inorganic triphosphatase YgiF